MPKWAWITQAGVWVVEAESDDAAYEKAIEARVEGGQTREEAEAWFAKDDRIEPILGSL